MTGMVESLLIRSAVGSNSGRRLLTQFDGRYLLETTNRSVVAWSSAFQAGNAHFLRVFGKEAIRSPLHGLLLSASLAIASHLIEVPSSRGFGGQGRFQGTPGNTVAEQTPLEQFHDNE
jgi:hypothetical protein